MITHAVGLSLGAASSIESGVAVREISSGKLIYVDKLFSMNDISLFFDNYPSQIRLLYVFQFRGISQCWKASGESFQNLIK